MYVKVIARESSDISDVCHAVFCLRAIMQFIAIVADQYACVTHCPDKDQKCGPMPNVMVALPNIGGALCSTPQSFADAHY